MHTYLIAHASCAFDLAVIHQLNQMQGDGKFCAFCAGMVCSVMTCIVTSLVQQIIQTGSQWGEFTAAVICNHPMLRINGDRVAMFCIGSSE